MCPLIKVLNVLTSITYFFFCYLCFYVFRSLCLSIDDKYIFLLEALYFLIFTFRSMIHLIDFSVDSMRKCSVLFYFFSYIQLIIPEPFKVYSFLFCPADPSAYGRLTLLLMYPLNKCLSEVTDLCSSGKRSLLSAV